MSSLSTEIIALADYVSVSNENKLTIAGIFDRFFVEKVPASWPSMAFVSVFKGKPDSKHKIVLIISDSTGKEILNKDFSITIGPSGKARFITNMQNFPLASYGEYSVELKKGKSIFGKYSFGVFKSKSQPRVKN